MSNHHNYFDKVTVEATNELKRCLITWKKDAILLRKPWIRTERNYNYNVIDADKVGILEKLLSDGADLNYLEKERGFACIPYVFWSQKLIRFFVDRGLNVNSGDYENGDTALHLAIRHNLHHYCDQVENDVNYKSPKFFCNVDLIVFLLQELNADPRVANLSGENALFAITERWAFCCNGFYVDCRIRIAKMIMRIEDCYMDSESHINNRIRVEGEVSYLYKETALMIAAKCDESLDQCRHLVDENSINSKDLSGYTALHHAVFNGSRNWVEFLIEMGADTNAKSSSTGFEPHDMINGIYPLKIIISEEHYNRCGLIMTSCHARSKLTENIQEIYGAMRFLRYIYINRFFMVSHNTHGFLRHTPMHADYGIFCRRVMEVCRERGLIPSQQFYWDNVLQVCKEIEKTRLHDNGGENYGEQLHLLAMQTVKSRFLSEDENSSKYFWHLLSLSFTLRPICINQHLAFYVFEVLNFLSEEMVDGETFGSMEMAAFETLYHMCYMCQEWVFKRPPNITSEHISLLHSMAQLIIACFDKLMKATKSNRVPIRPCFILYCRLYHLLFMLRKHQRFHLLEDELRNEQLLKTLVDLDLREELTGNSLIHYLMTDKLLQEISSILSLPDLILGILDFVHPDEMQIRTTNLKGFDPVQMINWDNDEENWKSNSDLINLLVKMADMGAAHVDARNVTGGPTLREVFDEKKVPSFHYDNLQCACARVLVKSSLVPLRNNVGVPKRLVDFILLH